MNKLEKILNTFKHRDDVIKKKKTSMLNNSKFASELYGGHLFIKHMYLQVILLNQNPIGKRKHGVPMYFDVVKDLQGFVVQKFTQLACDPKQAQGTCNSIYTKIVTKFQFGALVAMSKKFKRLIQWAT
jgi:hypothetical protein